MKDVEHLLRETHDLGARVCLVGDKIRVEGPRPLPGTLVDGLRRLKCELRCLLQTEPPGMSSLGLPFPLGYGGLPVAQIEVVETINDKFCIKNPVHRRYNVLSWVRGYYDDRGESQGEHYEMLVREQQGLSHTLRDQGISL